MQKKSISFHEKTNPLTSSTAIKSLPSPELKSIKPSGEVVLSWKKRCMDV